MAYWYPILGYGIFWFGLIAAIIIFLIKRKFFPIMYLVAISLYVFTVGFVIDVYDLSKNAVLLVLAVSTGVMMFLGWYWTHRFKDEQAGSKKQMERPPMSPAQMEMYRQQQAQMQQRARR